MAMQNEVVEEDAADLQFPKGKSLLLISITETNVIDCSTFISL